MNKFYVHITYFLCLLVFNVSYAQENWDLIKDKKDIKVYTRTNTVSSFKEFKGITEIKAKVNDFLAVLYDIDGLPDWAYNIKESRLLDRSGENVQVYYAVAKAPWPYKNRDGVYKNSIKWDPEKRELMVEIEMLEDVMDPNDSYVRMDGYGYWKIRERSNDLLEVTFQMQVDPGGSIKAWMANMFVSDSPFFTLLGLRESISLDKYQSKSFEILKD
ncbi:START domain-containing protein [Lutimonas zeaxanthinifaciens]|uniref:START domain-containing protein n=1 Tax=Lutimonas zeaxanthinifaciens TaxID=3060215 RepID=UPI00265D4F6F|nr:START domain-containing protein [Lutimonas sp. YSD2104]WKK65643.1 START domain-containing protein [Lutimonas sp. YSD2104]